MNCWPKFAATHLKFCLQVLYGDLQIFVALDGRLSGALQGHKLVLQATVYSGRGESAFTSIHCHLYIPVEELIYSFFLYKVQLLFFLLLTEVIQYECYSKHTKHAHQKTLNTI